MNRIRSSGFFGRFFVLGSQLPYVIRSVDVTDAVKMIDFMLKDARRPTAQVILDCPPVQIKPAHLDRFMTFDLARQARNRQAAIL